MLDALESVAKSVAACVALAYIAGWSFWFGYLLIFRAGWLMSEIPLATYLRSSALPALLLLVIIVVVAEHTQSPSDPAAPRAAAPITARVLGALDNVIDTSVRSNKWVTLASIASVSVFITTILLFVLTRRSVGFALVTASILAVVTYMVLGVAQRRVAHRDPMTRIVLLTLLGGFALPACIGLLGGIVDRFPKTSTLPEVCIRAEPCPNPAGANALLMTTPERVYAVDLRDSTLRPLAWDRISVIRPSRSAEVPPQP